MFRTETEFWTLIARVDLVLIFFGDFFNFFVTTTVDADDDDVTEVDEADSVGVSVVSTCRFCPLVFFAGAFLPFFAPFFGLKYRLSFVRETLITHLLSGDDTKRTGDFDS